MLALVTDAVKAGKDAVHAEAVRLKRRAALNVAMMALIALGVAFAMAGVGVLLAPVIGLGWSLLVVAGFLIIVGGAGALILASQR